MITIKNLAQATAQQVFDQAVNHLMTQGKRSAKYLPDGTIDVCTYRIEGSKLTCGAGIFISDDEYTPEMEGNTWIGLVKSGLVTTNKYAPLMMRIQSIHDCYEPHRWEVELKDLAKMEGLQFTYTAPLLQPANAYKGLADTIEINITR